MNDFMIEKIIKEEWRQFQLINHEGGTAWFQDKWEQFYIMRKSQFMCWTEHILNSYYDDLFLANKNERNLLFERNAWMMESTAPKQFDEIRHVLPFISEERKQRINRAAAIQAKWGEEFAKEYPNMASNGMKIYSSEDTPRATSIETYTRGELLSYSEKTEMLVSNFIFANEEKGINLAQKVRENMVKLFGYKSLDKFEKIKNNLSLRPLKKPHK